LPITSTSDEWFRYTDLPAVYAKCILIMTLLKNAVPDSEII